MCGRYSHKMTWQEIHDLYSIHDAAPPPNSYKENRDTRPTVAAPILVHEDSKPKVVMARWWFQPDWAKAFDTKFSMFNARTDKLLQSKAYLPAFKRGQRCLVPMDGFYEWTGPKDNRQCHWIQMEGGAPYSLAGIYNRHNGLLDKDGNAVEYSFTIFTTEPCPSFKPYHHRMVRPVPQAEYSTWMDPAMGHAAAFEYLRPMDETRDNMHWRFTAIDTPGAQGN